MAEKRRTSPNRVRELREDSARMWSQEDLARAAGLSLFTIHRVETGKTTPARDTVRKIAKAFGLPVEEVFPPSPTKERVWSL